MRISIKAALAMGLCVSACIASHSSAQLTPYQQALDAAQEADDAVDRIEREAVEASQQAPMTAPAGRYPQSNPELKRQWLTMNEECRGGQHSPDDDVCTARDNIGVELERRGICWSYSDWRVYPTDYDWHPCSQATPKGWKPE